jgi:hypothetical protein
MILLNEAKVQRAESDHHSFRTARDPLAAFKQTQRLLQLKTLPGTLYSPSIHDEAEGE